MAEILVNVGTLSSFNSLIYHLSAKITHIRQQYVSGNTPQVVFDLRNARYGTVNMAALTAFLSISKRLRDYIGYPIPLILKWDPEFQGFLADVGFIELSTKFSIFEWIPNGILGGYKTGKLNPNTKIVYFGDFLKTEPDTTIDYEYEKAIRKQRIAPNFLLRFSNIFSGIEIDKSISIIANTALELIVNSLIHGEDIAFVGMQRMATRISVCVCDSGVGFPRSLTRTFADKAQLKKLTHIEGIVIGSLIQKKLHGLRLAIGEILNYREDDPFNNSNDGWVTISSYDTEVRWQKNNWRNALTLLDSIDLALGIGDVRSALGDPIQEYVDRDMINDGYWKTYSSHIVGTRIAFEIGIAR